MSASLIRVGAKVAVGVLLVAAAPAAALAQVPIDSTAALKAACENSSDNVVRVDTGLKIFTGVRPGDGAEQVATGCTLELGPNGKFEADQVSMAFNGPFTVRSSGQSSAVFTGSRWQSTAASFDLSAGPKGEVKIVTSQMVTTVGDFVVRVGVEGQFQAQYLLGTSLASVEAAGAIRIAGGDKLLAQIAATGLHGTSGIHLRLDGRDSVFKSERAGFSTVRGPVVVTSTGEKNLVEINQDAFEPVGGDARIAMDGAESTLKFIQTLMHSDGGEAELRAGGPAAPGGLVEIVDSQLIASQAVAVLASQGGSKGVVKVAKSRLTGGSDVELATGSAGVTEVKENRLNSGRTLQVLTGPGGSCIAELNLVSAPGQRLCLQ